jgi:hypothetical protein
MSIYNKRIKSDSASWPVFVKYSAKSVQLALLFMRSVIRIVPLML